MTNKNKISFWEENKSFIIKTSIIEVVLIVGLILYIYFLDKEWPLWGLPILLLSGGAIMFPQMVYQRCMQNWRAVNKRPNMMENF